MRFFFNRKAMSTLEWQVIEPEAVWAKLRTSKRPRCGEQCACMTSEGLGVFRWVLTAGSGYVNCFRCTRM
jgi:hypothetical protein